MLVYRERCTNRSSALRKECRMKALSRSEKESRIKSAAKRRRRRKESE